MNVVSIVEEILDEARPTLLTQGRKARGEIFAGIKPDSIEYDERMKLPQEIN